MAGQGGIKFFVDEQLPSHLIRTILGQRGHRGVAVNVGFKDPAIIVTADRAAAVILTADGWFIPELFRYPLGHKRCYARAAVVQLPGEWQVARPRLVGYLPVIEIIHGQCRGKTDARFSFDLSSAVVHIRECS